MQMNVLLVGYGKMGKIIERVALERGHKIAGRIDIENQEDLESATADVAIEFSHPSAAYHNVRRCLQKNIPVVCGTTGWVQQKPEVEKYCREVNGTFFYASNYSPGVNIFFKMNDFLARMMNIFEEYDVSMEEIHHSEKKDAPSGTAITLAEEVIKQLDRKKSWNNETGKNPDEVFIKSFRVDQVPGTHLVQYTSAIDTIEIKHTAHSREGFAKGAVMVAEWLRDKKGVLGMDDFLKF